MKLYFKSSNLGYNLSAIDGCNYDIGDGVDQLPDYGDGPGSFYIGDAEDYDEDYDKDDDEEE